MEGYRCNVGNLGWGTTRGSLQKTFGQFGEVIDSKIINDPETGRPRGFGYVIFKYDGAMWDAIEGMNGQYLDGKKINVCEPQSRGRGGGGGGGFCGGHREGGGGGGGYGHGRSYHEWEKSINSDLAAKKYQAQFREFDSSPENRMTGTGYGRRDGGYKGVDGGGYGGGYGGGGGSEGGYGGDRGYPKGRDYCQYSVVV